MGYIESVKEKAKKNIKTIVLPEADDIRILEATDKILKENIANVILIGNEDEVTKIANSKNFNISKATIIDPNNFDKIDKYANDLYELRKAKGMTFENAKKLLTENSRYFGTMMVKENDADGLVSGASHTTADTLKPALQIIKGANGVKTVSAFFIMELPNKDFGENGVFIFADCGMNANPDVEQLSDIAISSAKSFRELISSNSEPRVAMLSYSTKGSAHSELVSKVVNATNLVHQKEPDLLVDGEMQLDAAIIPEVANRKAPGSEVAGKANILIFPDLDAGNIGYKLTQRFGNAIALGPLCQGLAKPINDLSRGCNADDIVGVVAITCIQASELD